MTLLKAKDGYLQKYIEAVEQRTPDNIINEQGFDFTIGAPLRAFGEGHAIVSAISQDTTEEECKKQARETLYILAGVETLPASKASGVLEITSTESIVISEGTPVYSTDTGNRVGEVVADVTFTNIETKNVTMIADEAGKDITFGAGTLFLTEPNQSGTNLLLIDNGTDQETDYERSLRVKDALKAKAHGTAPALIFAAESVVLKDGNGIVIESVKNVLMAFPWKHEDPETIDPDDLGEIIMSIQSSLGVPSQDLLDAIELELTGNDELDGKQGAGQNVVLIPVETVDIAFSVPYKKLDGYDHSTIAAQVDFAIRAYVADLFQGEPINPTDWQAAISDIEGVDYYDEANLSPSTIQTIDQFKIWNVTTVTVTEI
jgi:hypothetical protein